MNEVSDRTGISPYRWVVLAMFMVVALLSQLLWLTFAPISSEAAKLFDVSAFDISLLSLVWPLVFVITAIPVGVFIDRRGFKTGVGTGAILMAVFAALRVFSAVPDYRFSILLLSQSGAALCQAFVFGSITKLAVSWFPEDEHGLATGLVTIGLFLGMMIALILTPALFLSFGMRGMLTIYAALSCAGALLFLVLVKKEDLLPGVKGAESTFTLRDIWNLSRRKDFLVLEYGFFACVGGFTAIMTWLEEMLHSLHGIAMEKAGIAGGLLIVGGIIGSIVIPSLSDRMKKIKPFILLDLAVGTIMLYLIGIIGVFSLLAVICFVTGFFLMSALPLVLEISSRIAGPGMEGRASSLLWFFSQVGSVLLIAMVGPVKSLWGSYYHSFVVIVVLWAVAFFLFIGVKETQ